MTEQKCHGCPHCQRSELAARRRIGVPPLQENRHDGNDHLRCVVQPRRADDEDEGGGKGNGGAARCAARQHVRARRGDCLDRDAQDDVGGQHVTEHRCECARQQVKERLSGILEVAHRPVTEQHLLGAGQHHEMIVFDRAQRQVAEREGEQADEGRAVQKSIGVFQYRHHVYRR